ncbi:MAG: SWIM zinc finger family protein [Planctomycetaceae bacterium]|jgi:hypothetical protein|nr:SWIM zinc finger family protein [Planctomycetaceae bacterium]
MRAANEIISLDETSPNNWRAKYRGNYGIYTIKITTDGKKTTKFSCSCPSDYYPCKHIAMIENAIADRIAQNKKVTGKDAKQKGDVTVEKLLRTATREELYQFLARQARYNKDLANIIKIEFANKTTETNSNPYSVILRKALNSVQINGLEDYYYESEEIIEVDTFDQMLSKLRDCFAKKNYREVVLISKACIEEFSEWFYKKCRNVFEIEMIDSEYYEVPFKMLRDVVNNKKAENLGIDLKELYDYCQVEIRKDKYESYALFSEFNDFFMQVSNKVNPDGFIELQDELLNKIDDKKSYEAKIILQRKIDFYNLNNQSKKAWDIIESNIQISSFRQKLAEKKVKEKKFVEAKKLINDYLKSNNKNCLWTSWEAQKLLLVIAQKEKDIPTIREISFMFIKNSFDLENFKIYKSTFTDVEWTTAFEQLFAIYNKRRVKTGIFDYELDDVAKLLVAEKAVDRLLEFVKKHLSVDLIDRYYENFATKYPHETLVLFRRVLDDYAKNFTGRDIYERIAQLLTKMQKISGGNKIVADMVQQYRVLYKNRKAMLKILSKF